MFTFCSFTEYDYINYIYPLYYYCYDCITIIRCTTFQFWGAKFSLLFSFFPNIWDCFAEFVFFCLVNLGEISETENRPVIVPAEPVLMF